MRSKPFFHLLLISCLIFAGKATGQSFYVAHIDSATVMMNSSVIIDVRANDTVTGPPCIYTADYSLCCGFGAPTNGTITIINNYSIKYTPFTGFTGRDNFIYAIAADTLHNSACDTARVFVNVIDPTYVKDDKVIDDFFFYSDPKTDRLLFVECKGIYEASRVTVYDRTGRIIHVTSENNDKIIPINLEGAASGLYIIEIQNSEIRFSKKIVIR
jgi:hypothetical protein